MASRGHCPRRGRWRVRRREPTSGRPLPRRLGSRSPRPPPQTSLTTAETARAHPVSTAQARRTPSPKPSSPSPPQHRLPRTLALRASSTSTMSFGRPATTSLSLGGAPPLKGSFPLDHDGALPRSPRSRSRACRARLADPGPRRAPAGECKEFMLRYLKCMKAAKQQSTDCRHLSKDYLKCRMDKCVRLSRSLARTFGSRT